MTTNPKPNTSFGSIKILVEKLLSGDQNWAMLRLFSLGALAFILLVASVLIQGFWRYLIVPFFAFILAFLAGVRYIQDIYELEGLGHAFRFLFSGFFGVLYPRLSVSGGRKNLKKNDVNLLDAIGGPGFVFVQPGNAVLYEGQSGPLSIYTAGSHFVPRFETLQPIALEDQYGEMESISAMTRDGFDIKVGRTRFRFRLLSDPRTRSAHTPYSYSEDAIYDMLYNRTVAEDGLSDWGSGVAGDVRRVISNYINRHTLDQLTAPRETGGDPRGDIKKELRSAAVKNNLRRRGTELLSIDIGNFEIPNKLVEQQRLSTWQVKWMGNARLARSYGEAQRLAHQEIGRAEAQAEMLISIMHALADVNLRGGTSQSVRDMVLLRTAQLLEAMGQNLPPEEKAQPAKDQGKLDQK
jgi:hypothetical protein